MTTVRGGNHSSLRHILRDRASKELSVFPQADNCASPLPIDPPMTNVLSDDAVGVVRSVTFEDNPFHPHDEKVPLEAFSEDDKADSAADSSLSSYWALMEYSLGENCHKPTGWNDDLSEDALQQLLGASLMTSPGQDECEAVLNDDTDPNVSWSEDENDPSTLESHFKVPKRTSEIAEDQSPRSISPTDDDDSNPILAKFLPNSSPFTTFRQNSTSIALEETQHYLRKIQSLEQQLQEAQQQVAELQQLQEFPAEKDPRATIFRTPAAHTRSSTRIRRSRSFSELSKPQTPASLMHHSESLWERNKTLVTEIRFADQTCMELACQNTALTKERDDWRKKYEAMEERNAALQLLVETTQRSLSQVEATMDSLRQVDPTARDENTELVELKSLLKISSQKAFETMEINQKLRREVTDMTAQIQSDKERTAETVRRIVHATNHQMERLHLAVTWKCSQYDAKLVAFANAIMLMEEAILEYDDDDEASDTIQTTTSSTGEVPEDEVDEDAVTVKSGCVNATFSENRTRNQSMELARMEEARASLPMDCVHGESKSPVISPDKSNATAKSDFLLSYFTGLSDNEVSVLSGGTSETGGSSNLKFLQHLQWMSSSPNPIQAFGVCGKYLSAQPESPGDISESTTDPVTSNFHRGFKHISRHHSNLSYSMSEPSPISKNLPSPGLVGRSMNEFVPHESIGNGETIENVSLAEIAEHMQSLHSGRETMLQMLDESLCQLSKLHDLASSQEHGLGILEETLQMERLAIENELHVATGDSSIDKDVSCSESQLGKDDLLRNLHEKVIEIEEAQDQIRYLQSEAKKRESLRLRYEALCLEKAEADALLHEKFIFPRTLIGKSDALIEKLYGEIATFREELAASTRKIEFLTSTFEALQCEKVEDLHELEKSLKRKAEECDALALKVEKLREDLDALKQEKQKFLETTAQLSDAINIHEETSANLQLGLHESKEKIVELQAEIQDINDRYRASTKDLKDMRDDRDAIKEQMASLSETCKHLEEEKSSLLTQLTEKDEMVDETNRLQLQMDMQVGELAHCFETIQSLENEILRLNEHRERSAEETTKVRHSNEYLESKCSRLKEYIRKLTQKCDEWEKYHDRESNVLHQLKQGYQWNRQKASELSVICQEKEQVGSLNLERNVEKNYSRLHFDSLMNRK
jgi:hypothetical protein